MEQKPDTVRVATPKDEDAVFGFLVELHRHNYQQHHLPYDPIIVLAQIEVGTREPKLRTNPSDLRPRGIIGVIDGPDGKIVGSVGVFPIPLMWFSQWPIFTEQWLFVKPEARDHRHLERDLFQFVRWVRDAMLADPVMKDTKMPRWIATGFMHLGDPRRFDIMERFWRRLTGGQKIASLYRVD